MNRTTFGLLLWTLAPIAAFALQKLGSSGREASAPRPPGAASSDLGFAAPVPAPGERPTGDTRLSGREAQLDSLYQEAARRYAQEDYSAAARLLGRILALDPHYREAAKYLKKAQFLARYGRTGKGSR